MTLEEFQKAAKARGVASGRPPRRYSEEERGFAVTYAEAQRSKGVPMSRIAERLGVCFETLKKWMAPEAPAGGFRRVRVKADGTARGIALVTPQGFRVEGLDLDTVAALLGKLG